MGRWEPEIPEGYRLGKARDGSDAFVGHLFDSAGRLVGHARWRWVEDQGSSREPRPGGPGSGASASGGSHHMADEAAEEWAELLALAGVALVDMTIKHVAPRVVRWAKSTAVPRLRQMWSRLTRQERIEAVRHLQRAAAGSPTFFRRQVDALIKEMKKHPENARARDELLGIFMLGLALRERIAETGGPGTEHPVDASDHRAQWQRALERLEEDDVIAFVTSAVAGRACAVDPQSVRLLIESPSKHAGLNQVIQAASPIDDESAVDAQEKGES